MATTPPITNWGPGTGLVPPGGPPPSFGSPNPPVPPFKAQQGQLARAAPIADPLHGGQSPFGQGGVSANPPPLSTGAAVPPGQQNIEPFDQNTANQLEEQSALVDQFLRNRMDPNFSIYGPQQRRAIDYGIGSSLARQQAGITNNLAGRGIGGGGLEANLATQASIGGARAAGDALAQIEAEDERSRRAAAGLFEDKRRFGVDTSLDQYNNSLIDFLNAVGDPTLEGPQFDQFDVIGAQDSGQAVDRFKDAYEQLKAEGNFTREDVIGIFTEAINNGANIEILIKAAAGMGFIL